MKKSKRFSPITPRSIDQFTSYIANTGLVTHDDLVRKALEMGHDPYDLIDASLGSIKYEKAATSLSNPLEDILNSVYEKDPTPGRRYVLDPAEAISERAKDVAKNLEGNLGVATSLNTGRSRSLPDYAAVRQQYDDLKKLQAISHAGHELKHQTDFLVRPDMVMKTDRPFKKGHHYKDIYETSELIREAKDLPVDQKEIDQIVKQSKKAYLKPSLFGRLRSMLGPIAAGLGAYSALRSGDTLGATLEAGSLLDPIGVVDAAAEINRRVKMNPEEQKAASKEDYYSAMPSELSGEQRMLDELEKYDEKGNLKKNR